MSNNNSSADTKEHDNTMVRHDVSLFTDHDIYLFKEGNHFNLYDKLGSHCLTINGKEGTYFALWAPNAKKISVIGDFNGWNTETHQLMPRWDNSGIWEGFIQGNGEGSVYKNHVQSKLNGYKVDKGEPYALRW